MLRKLLLLICSLSLIKVANFNKENKDIVFSTPTKENILLNPEQGYGYERALEDVGVFSVNKKTGKDINIGVLDSGIPDTFTPFIEGRYDCNGTVAHDHSRLVASIIGGKDGIANDANMYFTYIDSYRTYKDCLDWLILEKKCNIINISKQIGPNYGRYDDFCELTDYYSKKYNVLFVCSNGNYNEHDGVVMQACPASSVNSIAVSANDVSLDSSFFNIKGENYTDDYSGILFGPNIYAPGEAIIGIPYYNSNETNYSSLYTNGSGTSYSAAFVTGIAALLMEEFPEYKHNISQLISVLMNSGNYMLNQTHYCDNEFGFGIINYEKARSISNSSFLLKKGQTEIHKSIKLKKGDTLKVVSNYLINGKISNTIGDVTDVNFGNLVYSLILKNNNTGEIISSSTKSNYKYLEYNDCYGGDYTLSIYSNGNENIGFSFCVKDELPSLSVNDLYLDVCPTLSFNNDLKSDKSYDLYFMNFKGDVIIEKNSLSSSSYTLSKDEWNDLISLRGKEFYSFYIINTEGKKIVSKPLVILEPSNYKNKIQIKPNEWGFSNQYYFETNAKSSEEIKIKRGDFEIISKRLRCGYIENSYIVLSPIRKNAGKAYLELRFNLPVYSYMFGITTWGTKEKIYNTNYSGFVEELDKNGNWHQSLDLINDISLSKNFYKVDRYECYAMNEGIYGLRFVVNGPATGTTNKGRICLDDLVFNCDPFNKSFISTYYESIGAY